MKTKPKILHVSMVYRLDTQTKPDPNPLSLEHCAWEERIFHYVGIQCRATIQTGSKRLLLASQGCWGVRSNLGPAVAAVEKEECDQLRDALAAQGFGRRAIAYAFERITVEKVKPE